MPTKLQSEIKQAKPFRSAAEEVFLNVLRTYSAFLTDFSELLRPYDLSQPQYNVLRILRGAHPEGLPNREISERMVSRDPDVTRLLDRMELRGIVARERNAHDRRVVTARLTAAGLELVNSIDEPVRAMHARQLGHMTQSDLMTLSALLEQARDSSREVESGKGARTLVNTAEIGPNR